MIDLSKQQWVGALFFTAGVALLFPLGVTLATELPTVALPLIYVVVVAFLYRRGNTLQESVTLVLVPTLFVAGVYIVVLSRDGVLPSAGVFGGLFVAGVAAMGVGYLYYGAIGEDDE